MLVVKTVLADRRRESADDMAAAATAPMPMAKIKLGVKQWRMMGNTMAPSPRSWGDGDPYEVEFQSVMQNLELI